MEGLFITSPIRAQVLPEHCVALNWLESHSEVIALSTSRTILLTFEKVAPPSLLHLRHFYPWKFCTSTLAFSVDIDHEGAHAICLPTPATPVIVMLIMASNSISLGPQSFDMQIRTPALKGPGSMLNATNNFIPIDQSNFGEADVFLD